MNISLSKIQIGELDAKDELIKDERADRDIFLNSFIVPDTVRIKDFESGSRFIIYGEKGSGKTAFLRYLRSLIDPNKNSSVFILFKTNFDEEARIRLLNKQNIITVSDQNKIEINYNFSNIWRYIIIKSFLSALKRESVDEGWHVIEGLKEIYGVSQPAPRFSFRDWSISKIVANIKGKIAGGPASLEGDIKFEFSRGGNDDSADLNEILDKTEDNLSKINFKKQFRFSVFFDELELVNEREDQRTRDFALIRDLILVTYKYNHLFWERNIPITLYASLRTEVLADLKREVSELNKIISSSANKIFWGNIIIEGIHPLLIMVERRIELSEIFEYGMKDPDVLERYFPQKIFGQNLTQFILDISMFRPRNIIALLSRAAEIDGNNTVFTEDIFRASNTEFSRDIWHEVRDDLAVAYSPKTINVIKQSLTGWLDDFHWMDLRVRLREINRVIRDRAVEAICDNNMHDLIERLYRAGAIGQNFRDRQTNNWTNRWAFRNFPDPIFEKKFQIHDSLYKEFALHYRPSRKK